VTLCSLAGNDAIKVACKVQRILHTMWLACHQTAQCANVTKQLPSSVQSQDHMAHEHLGPRLPTEHGDAGCNANAPLPCRPLQIMYACKCCDSLDCVCMHQSHSSIEVQVHTNQLHQEQSKKYQQVLNESLDQGNPSEVANQIARDAAKSKATSS